MADPMDGESSPDFQALVKRPEPEEFYTAAKFMGLSRHLLERVYTIIQQSDHKIQAPGGQNGNMFDDHMKRVRDIYGLTGHDMMEGLHVPVAPQQDRQRRLPVQRRRKELPELDAGAITPEVVQHVSPAQVQARAFEAAESAALLSEALIYNILEHYDYHVKRWKTELRHNEHEKPAALLQRLLTAHIELAGTPDERMLEAIAARTRTDVEKWREFAQRCVDQNMSDLKADGVLDFLETRGVAKSGPTR